MKMAMFKRFALDYKGKVAVMFALASIPVVGAAGVAIDMVQTNAATTVLQSAVDAAAIAGANSVDLAKADLEGLVKKYLIANNSADVLKTIEEIVVNTDVTTNTLSVKIIGKRDTSLMYLLGIDEVEIGATAEVKLPGDGLEVALVLDNTGSMNEAGRMPALKTAAKALVSDLLDKKASGAYIKIGVVPFSEYVNVGVSRRGESWLDVDPDKTETKYACWQTYPNATKYDCKDVPNFSDGIQYGMVEQCQWDYGQPKEVCGDVTINTKWNGCVGSRVEPLDESIGSISTPYKGLMDYGCTSEIVPITDDKATLDSTIDGLVATGATYVPAGLLWGWNLLDEHKPITGAKSKVSMTTKGGTKAIVLMTDGQNTLAPYAPYHWGGAGASDWAKGDAKTAALCEKIKQDGVMVYTVSFMITDANAKSLMQNCASDATMALSADDPAQLTQAFEDVGASLLALRLSK